jgi:hypothetical protein
MFNVTPKNLPHKTSASDPLNPDQGFFVNLDPGFGVQKIKKFTEENLKYLYVKNTIFIFSGLRWGHNPSKHCIKPKSPQQCISIIKFLQKEILSSLRNCFLRN